MVPLWHFPPFFSIVLALLEFMGLEALSAARLLNIILFAGTIAITGLAIEMVTHSVGFSVFGALLSVLSVVLLEIHTAAMSEALYLFLALLGLIMLAYFHKKGSSALLILSAIVVGLAFLTRYVGIALVVTGALGLLLGSQRGWLPRLRNLFLFLIISLLPMAIWMTRNVLVLGAPTDRTFAFRPIGLGFLRAGLNTILLWLAPGRIVNGREVLILAVISTALVVAAAIWLARNRWRWLRNLTWPTPGLPLLLAIYCATYLGAVLLARGLFDSLVPVDNRLLSPVHQAAIILLAVGLASLWKLKVWAFKLLSLGIAIAILVFYGIRAAGLMGYLYEQGLGYTSRGWHSSEGLQYVRSHPNVPIYTNAATAIYFWTGRVTYPIGNMSDLRKDAKENCAVVVAFNSIPLRLYNVTAEQLSEGTTVAEVNDALIYSPQRCG
ncbi:MAG: hypothetical protein ACC700_13645 [Anaerolineales bacterium]